MFVDTFVEDSGQSAVQEKPFEEELDPEREIVEQMFLDTFVDMLTDLVLRDSCVLLQLDQSWNLAKDQLG